MKPGLPVLGLGGEGDGGELEDCPPPFRDPLLVVGETRMSAWKGLLIQFAAAVLQREDLGLREN